MADRIATSPPSSGVVGGGVLCVALVATSIGVSASGAGYPPTIPRERETEPNHPDPEDEMQEVVGSVHGHEVGRRFLADDEPVHEQHEVDHATEHQVIAGLRCGARHNQAG